mmetsp:Transcript_26458/g.39300  ORF Transcript_26458/g.39300 Transcript_26458/m.39300 type:complete len:197 (-) Transcript_26458:119-709(-)|eukprot:CAMPEP_0116021594 /NCGR_PEP_ID=MMETSP0321-20121206/10486_1 /TAXON_ID=163516 /ORGANISM="Leptocylindrus danicus var. danicus, Strain B650" /LENGTH=196 /DNA_ID=CAMNT_0003492507 /DNA_START=30 /DNA_END=620 /DNA_ORIENTATION=+
MAALLALNVTPHELKVNRSNQICALLDNTKPDVVIFDRFFAEEAYSFHIKERVSNALRVLDMQDFHALRTKRQEVLQGALNAMPKISNSFSKDANEFLNDILYAKPNIVDDDMLKRELASIHRCDLVLVCSETESKLLSNKYGIDAHKLVVAPFFCEPLDQTRLLEFEERSVDFVTIGGFWHGPNVDGLPAKSRVL